MAYHHFRRDIPDFHQSGHLHTMIAVFEQIRFPDSNPTLRCHNHEVVNRSQMFHLRDFVQDPPRVEKQRWVL